MQEDSLMIVIPGNPKDIKDPKKLEANLRSKNNIEINKISLDEFKRIVMDLSIDKREYTIIKYRYGLEGCDVLPQREIAKKLGISRSYISRIESKVLLKLRDYITENNIDL